MGTDLGKSPEKEPVLCHRVDHLRHGGHGTVESGRESGSVCENVQRRGCLLPGLHGVRCLYLVSQSQGMGLASDRRWGENKDTDL